LSTAEETTMREKVCPVVHQQVDGVLEVLAFRHPSAGNQFVKGTIEDGEPPPTAALRELREESGNRGRFPGEVVALRALA